MAWKLDEKQMFIALLQRALQDSQEIEILLRIQKKKAEADRVWERNQRLSNEIDFAIGRAIDKWVGTASGETNALHAGRVKIDAAVAEIRKKIDVAKNVVKAINALDEIVKIARKILV